MPKRLRKWKHRKNKYSLYVFWALCILIVSSLLMLYLITALNEVAKTHPEWF